MTREDYSKLKDRILAKLERMGLKDLCKHVVFEHFWTPLDIRARYNSNCDSIYGSVNPGGGMPMVVLCGQNVAKKVVAWDRAGTESNGT